MNLERRDRPPIPSRSVKNSGPNFAERRRRGRWAYGALATVLAVFAAGFARFQIFGVDQYIVQARTNHMRVMRAPPPRGVIHDRNGRAIAENIPSYDITLLPGPYDSIAARIDRLAGHLNLSSAQRDQLLAANRANPGEALVVRKHARFAEAAFIEERRPQFRRVTVNQRPRRLYHAPRSVAHITGYVGEISPEELARPEYAGYRPGQTVGKTGLEAYYESRLAGKEGVRYVEVNALGSIVRSLESGLEDPVEPGADLHLGIDADLQAFADSIFPADMKGGVVGIDPATGEVLLLYSHPTFDPNDFVGGIPSDTWASLRDDPGKPMLDRVSMASYPPGSSWKLVISAVGLNAGVFALDDYQQNACRGGLAYGNRFFRCWSGAGHGPLDLSGAIKGSCNVWFYQAGQRIGLDRLLGGVNDFGFRELSGIDLPGETGGFYPDSREWYDRRYGPGNWSESVEWQLSIGQAENQQSLLAMAQFYAALATGESPVRPHLVRDEALAQRRAGWTLGLPDAQRTRLVDALVRVVNERGGTAYGHHLARWTLAGKTGTAQNPHGEPHSWFVGFAPAYDPRIVVAAVVEHGHPDGEESLAVPLASNVVRRYLESIAMPPEATPGARPPLVATTAGTP